MQDETLRDGGRASGATQAFHAKRSRSDARPASTPLSRLRPSLRSVSPRPSHTDHAVPDPTPDPYPNLRPPLTDHAVAVGGTKGAGDGVSCRFAREMGRWDTSPTTTPGLMDTGLHCTESVPAARQDHGAGFLNVDRPAAMTASRIFLSSIEPANYGPVQPAIFVNRKEPCIGRRKVATHVAGGVTVAAVQEINAAARHPRHELPRCLHELKHIVLRVLQLARPHVMNRVAPLIGVASRLLRFAALERPPRRLRLVARKPIPLFTDPVSRKTTGTLISPPGGGYEVGGSR